MKFLISLVFVTILTIPGFAQSPQSWEQVKVKGSGKLSVLYFESPGIIQLENGRPVGLGVDLLERFVVFLKTKKSVNVTIEYVGLEKDFNTFLTRIEKTKNMLGAGAITITDQRKSRFDFTPSYLNSPNVVITNKGIRNVSSLSELSGLTPLALTGSTQINWVRKISAENPKQSIQFYATPMEILQKISSSSTCFTVLGFNDFKDANRKNLQVKMQSLQLGESEKLAFAMSKDSDWNQLWDEFLTPAYLKSAEYQNLIIKNIGSVYLKIVN